MKKIVNVFTQDQINLLNNLINNSKVKDDTLLGRKVGELEELPNEVGSVINNLVNKFFSKSLRFRSTTHVEYNNKYGIPNLPPHFDGDKSDLICNFQLESNTTWDLGLNLELHSLEDNSALLFNPNELIHWRPIKQFKNDEYIKMIFFRFTDLDKKSDYSHLKYSLDHEIFKEINKFRNSLNYK